jgi:hypothetical protein
MNTSTWNDLSPRKRDAAVSKKLFGKVVKPLPRYTTDPRDCALVKARCEYFTVAKEHNGYIAMVQIDKTVGVIQESRQPTEELAVCLAALKAD